MITLRRHTDATELAFLDGRVTRVAVTGGFRFDVTDSDLDNVRVTLGRAFEVRHPGGETWELDHVRVEDERLGRLAFALHDTWLTWCRATARGALTIVFENGITLRATPGEDHGAWEIVHERFQLTGVAGGGLSVRDGTAGDGTR